MILLTKCLVCDSDDLETVLDLGDQPLANDYYSTGKTYPLSLMKCTVCFHNQINCQVPPTELFSDYIYKSGTSNTGKEYFKTFAREVTTKNVKKVLDIACNDGSQLDAFSPDIKTVGIDPAKNLCKLVDKRHDVFCDFFNQKIVDSLSTCYDTFDIIIAQNVFAHIDYPKEFLRLCSTLMNDNSRLYIQVSQAYMITNGEFDTVYHEHLSFFNTHSMSVLTKQSSLYLINVYVKDIHGGSYLFELRKREEVGNAKQFLQIEKDTGMYTDFTIQQYRLKCEAYKTKLLKVIQDFLDEGYIVIGYGSTAKSNTVLNYCKLTDESVSYIIDDNELKQGLYTPGSNIPVVHRNFLYTVDPKTVVIVFAWNYYPEICLKIKKINSDILVVNTLF